MIYSDDYIKADAMVGFWMGVLRSKNNLFTIYKERMKGFEVPLSDNEIKRCQEELFNIVKSNYQIIDEEQFINDIKDFIIEHLLDETDFIIETVKRNYFAWQALPLAVSKVIEKHMPDSSIELPNKLVSFVFGIYTGRYKKPRKHPSQIGESGVSGYRKALMIWSLKHFMGISPTLNPATYDKFDGIQAGSDITGQYFNCSRRSALEAWEENKNLFVHFRDPENYDFDSYLYERQNKK